MLLFATLLTIHVPAFPCCYSSYCTVLWSTVNADRISHAADVTAMPLDRRTHATPKIIQTYRCFSCI